MPLTPRYNIAVKLEGFERVSLIGVMLEGFEGAFDWPPTMPGDALASQTAVRLNNFEMRRTFI